MKTCTGCGKEKELQDFYVERYYKEKPYYNVRCKPCALLIAYLRGKL